MSVLDQHRAAHAGDGAARLEPRRSRPRSEHQRSNGNHGPCWTAGFSSHAQADRDRARSRPTARGGRFTVDRRLRVCRHGGCSLPSYAPATSTPAMSSGSPPGSNLRPAEAECRASCYRTPLNVPAWMRESICGISKYLKRKVDEIGDPLSLLVERVTGLKRRQRQLLVKRVFARDVRELAGLTE